MNTEKGAVMADVSVEARVEQLMELVDKLKHAEVQLYSGGLIWGDAYEAKKAPIRAMQSELREKLTAALSANNQERAEAGAVTDAQIQLLWGEACRDSPSAPGWGRHIRFARSVLNLAATSTTPADEGAAVKAEPLTQAHRKTALILTQRAVDAVVHENIGFFPRNDNWADEVLSLRDALE